MTDNFLRFFVIFFMTLGLFSIGLELKQVFWDEIPLQFMNSPVYLVGAVVVFGQITKGRR